MQLVKALPLSLRTHAFLNERWVQTRIEEDPALLGLGPDLIVRAKEKIQPSGGRLDLLLQEQDGDQRYEVEIQLGATDESHIIRTIEYWDIERKRYPQYEHTAVIVAEEITGRFLNVISLFNGAIPLIAIKMAAYQLPPESLFLTFTTVLDVVTRGSEDEEEAAQETDRTYWERDQGSKETVAAVDRLAELAKKSDPSLALKYNKFFIGLARDGRPDNFVVYRARRKDVRFDPRIPYTEELDRRLNEAGLDQLPYAKNEGRYRVRLLPAQVDQHKNLLAELTDLAYRQRHG